ncbi:hypothetical protein BPULL_1995 [Bifidobacterium pullorum]|uniref:Uncharacterized protein n=1 Tax=Bifidobacterium pullorum TaxID=78448 RepID=A0A7V8HQ76_9BIFI|nr:hypothetical protein BPULL_1995 [Bifidobacterium pullorum]
MAQHKGSLGGGVFSIREVEYLESLPAVDRVRSGRIVYNDAFKRDRIRRYRNGESPAEIFRSAGLDSALIGYKRIERSIARWKATLGDDGAPPTVPSPFIVSTDSRWNPSQCRRLNSVSAQPDRRYRYVDDTADTVSIGPSEPRQQTMPEPDPRNLIIAQQSRRIQELEIEISELKRARRDTTENVIGGGVFYLALLRFRGSGGGYRGILDWCRPSDGWQYACSRRTTATSRHIRGEAGVRRVGTRSVWKERYARLTSQEERRHPAARVA